MGYKIAYYMDVGPRETQEDCLLIDGLLFQQDSMSEAGERSIEASRLFLAVCDGMGGHAKGEWASRFVCERLGDFLKASSFRAGSALPAFSRVQSEMELSGPSNSGAAVACVEIDKESANIYNAGDCRVYKLAEGELSLLSHDHSLVQTMVDSGSMSAGEARRHPYRHILEFGMGTVFARQWQTSAREIYFREDRFRGGDFYLICSDGVHDALSDQEICGLLSPQPFARLHEFVGGLRERLRDNASFVLAGNEG